MDVVDPVVVESAAVLARHLRQGRDRRLAVLEWFAEAGTLPVEPEAVRVLEPPIGAVRQALVWVLERSVAQRLMELARGAAGTGEGGLDALYAAAGRIPGPYRGVAHPTLVRAALETGEDLPAEAEGPDFRSVVHLVAAIGLGAREVGVEALAEAFTGLNLYGLTVDDWQQILSAAERGEGPPVNWALFERCADAVGPVKRASDEELTRARTVLIGLRGFYCMYCCTDCSCRTPRHRPRYGSGSTTSASSLSWTLSSSWPLPRPVRRGPDRLPPAVLRQPLRDAHRPTHCEPGHLQHPR
ncbi:hypothetical protein OIE49_36460 [Streptomyces sp. NBC_01788]|uniref:hypothetical protein n=1 Tax=Streptomyces sp. NBC_01788 TaxID=2975940 RepID=UPI002DDAEE3A|nr:hypothetical protein [Streptomyces sp. NBC_01788]WSB30889.1 hypothetical protein OIE49_36460 [Streptomyces sp. NBC_01788]